MLNKLIEHIIKGLRNEPPIIQDPLTPAHNSQNVIGIWFYSPSFGTLLYSTTAESHSEKDKFPGYNENEWWLRGRLFRKGLIYLLAYTDNGNDAQITLSQFYDLVSKLENAAKVSIDYAVDSDGYELG
jgi:hypothetical protein